MTGIEVPFDPKPVFGKVRAPVRVTVNGGYTFRSTIAAMGGPCCFIPLRRSNREAAGVSGGEMVTVTLTLDTQPRVVKPPAALMAALKGAGPDVVEAWKGMSFTHQREHAEAVVEAKKPETRARRIAGCVGAMKERVKARAAKAKARVSKGKK